jgi:hypothetical protein
MILQDLTLYDVPSPNLTDMSSQDLTPHSQTRPPDRTACLSEIVSRETFGWTDVCQAGMGPGSRWRSAPAEERRVSVPRPGHSVLVESSHWIVVLAAVGLTQHDKRHRPNPGPKRPPFFFPTSLDSGQWRRCEL